MLLQLASESKEELVTRRGRLWTWPVFTGVAEVREAIRLDIPSPLGARILLVVKKPRSLTFLSSFTVICRCCTGGQEPGRPTVENWPGITVEIPGPAAKS